MQQVLYPSASSAYNLPNSLSHGTHRTTFQSTQAPLLTSVTLYSKGYTLQHTTMLLTLRTLNLHSNNYARKFTQIYTLNLSSRTFCNILKKKQDKKSYDMQKFTPNFSKHNYDVKQEEKSYDMQKFTPNHSKCNCDVTSTNFDLMKLRNGEICPEYL